MFDAANIPRKGVQPRNLFACLVILVILQAPCKVFRAGQECLVLSMDLSMVKKYQKKY